MAAPWENYQEQEAPAEEPKAEAAPAVAPPVEAPPKESPAEAPVAEGPWTKYQVKESAPVAAEPQAESQRWTKAAEEHPVLGRAAAALHGAGELIPGREKMSAGLHALLSSGEGGFEERYKKQLDRQRAAGRALEEAYPGTHLAGMVAPMLTPLGAESMLAGESAIGRAAGKALPFLGERGKNLAGVAGFGGLYGAAQGAAEGDTAEEKLSNALTSGAIGATVGPVLQGAGKLAKSVIGPAGKTAAQEAAERLGPEVSGVAPRFVTSEAPVQGVAASGIKAIPFAGEKISEASQKLNEALGNKIISVAGTAEPTPQMAGEKLRGGINKWIGEDSTKYITGLYDDVTKTFDNQNFKLGFPSGARANHPLNATSKVFNDMAEFNLEKGAAPGKEINSAMNIVKDALDRPEGLTFRGLQGLRQDVGDLLNSQEIIADKVKQKQLKQLYGGLSEDLKKAALNEGGVEGYKAFRTAENEYKKVAAKRNLLRKITGVGERYSDEQVLDNLANMVKNNRGDLKRLNLAKESLTPNDWNQVVSNMVHRIGYQDDALGKGFSPAKFLTAYSKMAPRARDVLFGAPGTGYRQNIDDIALLAKNAVKAGEGINTSKTAHVQETLKMLGKLGTVVGGVTGLNYATGHGAGDVGTIAGETAGTLGGGYLLASLLASPRGSFALKNWMQTASPQAGKALLDEVSKISGRAPKALESTIRTQATTNMGNREHRASGGKIDKRDYPAKRLTRMEKALLRAQKALAEETKPIMEMPDDHVAHALEIAKDK